MADHGHASLDGPLQGKVRKDYVGMSPTFVTRNAWMRPALSKRTEEEPNKWHIYRAEATDSFQIISPEDLRVLT
jgi:hypothetical protein